MNAIQEHNRNTITLNSPIFGLRGKPYKCSINKDLRSFV